MPEHTSVVIHTTQPYLAYKLTTIQIASRGTILRAAITIKLNKEDIMLIIQDIYI